MAQAIKSLFMTIGMVLLVVFWLAFCNQAMASQPKNVQFECDGFSATWKQSHVGYPILMTISTERGTWMEVPDSITSTSSVFINLDTQKVARMGINTSNQLYLEWADNTVSFNRGSMAHSLRCRIK